MSGAALAILGDYVPIGMGQALGLLAGGNSLDNTLRVARLVPTEWVMLDIRVHAVDHGFGHGARAPLGTRTARCSRRRASRASSGSGRTHPADVGRCPAHLRHGAGGGGDVDALVVGGERLGAAISAVDQWHWSVGAVANVGLSDGRRVTLEGIPVTLDL